MDIVTVLPGRVIEIKVTKGQLIEVGDVVMTLEVMKMTQELAAETGGVVASIGVEEGQELVPGQVVATLQ
ncbi:MAG: acyl-CoA carboxylase biotin carboxyl carrier protein subunit [Thermoleophilia bacterium]